MSLHVSIAYNGTWRGGRLTRWVGFDSGQSRLRVREGGMEGLSETVV